MFDFRSLPPLPGSFRRMPTPEARLIHRSTVFLEPMRAISHRVDTATDAWPLWSAYLLRRMIMDRTSQGMSPDSVANRTT